jgi:hypothetical protein
LLLALSLALAGAAYAEIHYSVAIHDIPNSSTGTVIGIPRQQAVCLSQAAHLVVMWAPSSNIAWFYKTTDGGASWNDTLNTGFWGGNVHGHLAVWNDTVYHFSPFYGSQAPQDSFHVQIIETGNLTVVANTGGDTVNYNPGSSLAASGQPTGNPNQMVAIARSSSHGFPFWLSSDRGRTWLNQHASVTGGDISSSETRMGLTSVGDSCMALLYLAGNIDVYHWRTSSSSWSRESTGHFISGNTQRVFSGSVADDTVYILAVNGDVSSYYVAKRRVGNGPIAQDTLWSGPPAYRSNPEYIGYGALQKIENLNTVAAFYVRPSNGSAGPDSSKLYFRLYYGGIWEPEQLISAGAGTANLTCPFVVPMSHGDFAYCQFKDYSGGHLATVRIDVGVTRGDIDRAIMGFRAGGVTLQEVLDLIERYNSGQ